MNFKYIPLFALPFLCNCSNSISPGPLDDFETKETSKDFVRVKTKGKSVEIRDLKTADDPDDETAAIQVRFTYDYFIENHEVTCGEYRLYMDEIGCKADSFPITNVTYIDAILYANARSKAEGFDTAYTYTSKVCNNTNCTGIEGLAFNPRAMAFRLPTEAEWILAAQQGWNTSNSWTSENSDIEVHPVCSKGKNALGICDLEGNVTEWVNDWLGSVKSSTVTNFVGSSEANSIGERVIKGGNYHNPTTAINIYNRGDVYTVTSATASDYLGFRLAFGEIPDAAWFSNGKLSQQTATTLLSNAGNVRRETHTFKTKLVFRDDISGNLVYIDYSSEEPVFVEIADTVDAFHPDISPDGEQVAFCTNIEGVNGKSEIYVRDLDAQGSNLVKLDVESAAIPRWRVLDSGDTVIVYVSSAQNNKNTETFLEQSTWMVLFANKRFGTPKKLFDGAYHGGTDNSLSFAVTGSTLLRAHTSKGRDTIWYDSAQACNASLSKDGSKRTLFLDFAGEPGKKFVGESYGIHERLLIADSSGKLIQSVPSPTGYSFDHTEWVSNNLVVATLTNNNGAHEKIVLVDISSKTFTELAHGEELWHPCVWTATTETVNTAWDLDSLGAYWQQPEDPLLTKKMNAFWFLADSIEILALGSSRVSMGYVPDVISQGFSYNMATIPSDMDVSYYLATNYILPHCHKLKAIVISLDLDLWSDKPEVNVKKNILSFPGFYYDSNHNFWKNEDISDLKAISKQIVSEQSLLKRILETRGTLAVADKNTWTTGGFNPNAIVSDSSWSNSSSTYKTALRELEELIQLAQDKDILVVGVVYPQSPYFAETGSFGRHGMRRSHAKKILEQIAALDSSYTNFVFMDENKMGNHDYADSLAYDYDHLNYYGAIRISSRIDSVIAKELGENP